MIYPDNIENKIGFSQLRDLLLSKCECAMGKKFVEEVSFLSDYRAIIDKLHQTSEYKKILDSHIYFPIGTLHDASKWLDEIKADGTYLSGDKLHRLSSMLASIEAINNFFSKDIESEHKFPTLSRDFSNISEFPEIIKEIDKCVNDYGDIKDNASDALAEIRLKLRQANGDVNKAMRRVLDSAIKSGAVEKDAIPSLRDGRMVIPVAAVNKRKINGIVHDQSGTGKTVFIEPVEVVEAANKIKHLEMLERQEVIVILKSIASLLRLKIDAIKSSVDMLGELDFIRAKAKLAIELNAELPTIEKRPEIDWYHAQNPQLLLALKNTERTPVAMDLQLNQQHRILLISGPNAGGKSVALKTVALVQYMMQCGLLPTLYSNSHMGIFQNILIDIGDEQSIENDLSTYSSHLKNMKKFISVANKQTLVLADEIGSGTEPTIGSALAQSILAELGRAKCFGVITTHYQSLKAFADETAGFINGAMLYDRQHLKPLYLLSLGTPGSSFALEIARNIGLPSAVVSEAENIVGKEYVENEKYILDITRDRKYLHNKRLNIREKEGKLNSLLENYENLARQLKTQRAEILRNARAEAVEILKGANAKLEHTIHEIRKAEAERERTLQLRKELKEYQEELESQVDNVDDQLPEILKRQKHKSRNKSSKASEPNKVLSSKSLQPGDFVKMKDGNAVGQILNISGKKAEVLFGNLRTSVNIDKLILSRAPEKKELRTIHLQQGNTDADSRERQLNFRNEIDVRGMRVDEAIQAITYFIDDALQFNASRIRILHGTGNGILRPRIRKFLNTIPDVKDYADEDVRFGGAGITVVNLD